ncbi:unnamed protein product [Trichogramma brassicae]|uniref:RNA methyltransferase n=1 Tax=Trichogramma brassicae TaxID=86971 RepID=A0A6H5I2D9_9HYME|nr:unnamed protein product [Trichogramma brassicae]
MTVHEGRKDFACNKCEKKFGLLSILTKHQKTVHEGRKDYACDKCEKRFASKSDLIKHQRAVHEGRKDYECDKCKKKFGHKSNLVVHQRMVHEGRRDYGCDGCEKKFGTKLHLLDHQRTIHESGTNFAHQKTVHEGSKEYACDGCEKKFGRKSDLIRHQNTVHNGHKNFACDICEKKFSHKQHLLGHQKTVHECRKDFACDRCSRCSSRAAAGAISLEPRNNEWWQSEQFEREASEIMISSQLCLKDYIIPEPGETPSMSYMEFLEFARSEKLAQVTESREMCRRELASRMLYKFYDGGAFGGYTPEGWAEAAAAEERRAILCLNTKNQLYEMIRTNDAPFHMYVGFSLYTDLQRKSINFTPRKCLFLTFLIMSDDKLHPSADEPGASRYGNFCNYYQFHSVEARVQQLPLDLLSSTGNDGKKFVALDIGCNAGNLTVELHKCLSEKFPDKEIAILGIDLDPTLIERARELNTLPDSISFQCLDFFSVERESVLAAFLQKHEVNEFDVTFCFSVTMWIHLNHGDAGLERFLRDVSRRCRMMLIEPQPWKCYRNAARRLKRAQAGDFPLLDGLKLKDDMVWHIERIMIVQCMFERLYESEENIWQRKLLLYKRSEL